MNSSEPVKRRLHWATAVVSAFRALPQLAPFLIIALLSGRGQNGGSWLIIMAVGLLPISLILGIIGWWRFQYWVQDGELRVEQGLLVRRKVFLHRERVQAIDVSAGVVQRIFGLVRVQIKSAAAGAQAELTAVTRAEAQRLREELGHPGKSETKLPQDEEFPDPPSPRYSMSIGQLLLAASTSSQIGVILSGIAWLFAQVDEIVRQRVIDYLESTPVTGPSSSTPLAFTLFIILGLLIAWLLSILGVVIRYGRFSVERRGDELVVCRGLLERKEVAIPVNRVQAVRIVESLPRQPLGYGALYVESAGHAEERGKSTYLHPCLPRAMWLPMLQTLLPEFAVEPTLYAPPKRALVRFLLRPILSSIVIATLATMLIPYGWLAFLLLPLRIPMGILAYRDTGLGCTERVAVIRSRGLSRQTAIVPHRAVQFAQSARSWLQRRRQVANAYVGVAAGASGRRFEARELDETLAAGFLSWCSHQGAEMRENRQNLESRNQRSERRTVPVLK